MRDISTLRSRIDTWRGLERRVRDVVELLELAMEESDDEISASATAELDETEKALKDLEFQLQLSGEYDNRNAILAVHAGAGGTESQDWAEMLLRMYLRWGERRGFKTDVLDRHARAKRPASRARRSRSMAPYAYGYLKSERGVHRLVRLSPFDSAHRATRRFALVEVLPEVEAAARSRSTRTK